MPSGGKRRGAGRTKGSPTIRRQKTTRKVLTEFKGMTPLEVMLKAMMLHVGNGNMDRAAAFAKDAAPYVHPRLVATEHKGSIDSTITALNITDMDRAEALVAFLARTKPLALANGHAEHEIEREQ